MESGTGLGGRKAREPRIAGHEATQRVRAGGDDVESPRQVLVQVGGPGVAGQQTRQRCGDRFDQRKAVVDLVAEHPHEALPGLPLLLPQRA